MLKYLTQFGVFMLYDITDYILNYDVANLGIIISTFYLQNICLLENISAMFT